MKEMALLSFLYYCPSGSAGVWRQAAGFIAGAGSSFIRIERTVFRLSPFFTASGSYSEPCLKRLPKIFPTFFQIFIATIFRSVYVVLKPEKAYARTLCMQSEYSITVILGASM